jgi:dipeptidyl aminopeptidase/acylaminoacyl peptidase
MVAVLLAAGCTTLARAPAPAVTVAPTSAPSPAPTPAARLLPSATPDPPAQPAPAWSIPGLRQGAFPGGPVELSGPIETHDAFTTHIVVYPSQGLRIRARMDLPAGAGPFPVVLVNHGYWNPATYRTGDESRREADYLAAHGYLTLASDYRGYGGSDGQRGIITEDAADVRNLIGSLDWIPQADPRRVGLMGHSHGGGVSQIVMVTDRRPLATVLYATISGEAADNYRTWWYSSRAYNGALGSPNANPENYALLSPIRFYDAVRVPVLILQGTADVTTPPRWSDGVRDALIARGQEVEYLSYPGQAHIFYGAAWDQAMARTLAFFDAHVRAGRAARGR